MKLFKRIFNKNIMQNRKLSKARILYLYVIFGSILGFSYFIVSIFLGWPKHFGLTPVYLLMVFFISKFFINNWKVIWFYIVNVEQGKLLLFLNKTTHWEGGFKMKVVKWVYLNRGKVRKETQGRLSKKAMDGEELTDSEKKLFKSKTVFCPQQIKLGFNEALLVNAVIHAHRFIRPLDEELRNIMDLTDDHILNFDIMKEYKKAGGNEYDKLIEIGKRKSKELTKSK